MGLETKLVGLAKTSKLCKKYVGIISFYRALLKTVRLLSKSWAKAQKIAPNPRHAINGTNGYIQTIFEIYLTDYHLPLIKCHAHSETYCLMHIFFQNLIETFVHNNILKVHTLHLKRWNIYHLDYSTNIII